MGGGPAMSAQPNLFGWPDLTPRPHGTQPPYKPCRIFTDIDTLLATGERFAVICLDPPWTFSTWSENGKGRSAEQHYRCQPRNFIRALPIADLAAPNCAVFVWTTDPMLPETFEILRAWGFEYKTVGFVWVKTLKSAPVFGSFAQQLHWGQGYYTRSNPEYCLLAGRGRLLRLDKGVHQVIVSPVQEHSRKPDEALIRIERLFDGPYLEMFARRPRSGWTCFGDELEAKP
jgi:N6-adenosine-specific RNA methylase IME4